MSDVPPAPDFATSGEDRSLWTWWKRHHSPGLLIMEVPIGWAGPGEWPNPQSHRRLDAIHVPGYGEPTFREWAGDHDELIEAVRGRRVELVEAKWELNYSVIGQCIAGVPMLSRAYPDHGPIVPVAVVRGNPDPALRWVCDRRGIEVHTVVLDEGAAEVAPEEDEPQRSSTGRGGRGPMREEAALAPHEAVAAVLRRIDDDVPDSRRPPDSGRKGAFKRGWRAHERGQRYSEEVLGRLTWDNLGYRLAVSELLPFATTDEDLEQIFRAAASGYEDGSLRLD